MASIGKAEMAKADAAMSEGHKALNVSGFASFFAGKMDKYENAVAHFLKAGNSYKVAKAWTEAGDAFTQAADCYQKMEQFYDAAGKLKEAGECFKKVNAQACVNSWRQAISVYQEAGKWNQCGTIAKSVAEMYEDSESNGLVCEDVEAEAIQSYEQAADYFNAESPPREQQANSCLEKVATLSASRGDCARAASIFDTLARSCLGNKLLKFNAKSHILRCLICHLVGGDNVMTENKLDEFLTLDQSLEGTREEKFLRAILAAVTSHNSEAFGEAAADFNSVKKIDPWMTSLLLKCKRSLIAENGGEDESEEEEEIDVDEEPAAADEEEDLT
jgi:alpha-soluble NSF attachment protein